MNTIQRGRDPDSADRSRWESVIEEREKWEKLVERQRKDSAEEGKMLLCLLTSSQTRIHFTRRHTAHLSIFTLFFGIKHPLCLSILYIAWEKKNFPVHVMFHHNSVKCALCKMSQSQYEVIMLWVCLTGRTLTWNTIIWPGNKTQQSIILPTHFIPGCDIVIPCHAPFVSYPEVLGTFGITGRCFLRGPFGSVVDALSSASKVFDWWAKAWTLHILSWYTRAKTL